MVEDFHVNGTHHICLIVYENMYVEAYKENLIWLPIFWAIPLYLSSMFREKSIKLLYVKTPSRTLFCVGSSCINFHHNSIRIYMEEKPRISMLNPSFENFLWSLLIFPLLSAHSLCWVLNLVTPYKICIKSKIKEKFLLNRNI